MFQTSFNPNNSLLIILQISLLFRFTPALNTILFCLAFIYLKRWEIRGNYKTRRKQIAKNISNSKWHKLNQAFVFNIWSAGSFQRWSNGRFHTRGRTNRLRRTSRLMCKRDEQLNFSTNKLSDIWPSGRDDFSMTNLPVETNKSTTVRHKFTLDGQMADDLFVL